jgi:hypothetical protein
MQNILNKIISNQVGAAYVNALNERLPLTLALVFIFG